MCCNNNCIKWGVKLSEKVTQDNSILMQDAMWDVSMTVYYRKKTGDIVQIVTGIHDMGVYGKEREDFELIRDFIVVEKDEFILDNMSQFHVDLDTKELIYTPLIDVSRYRMR